MTPNAAMLLVIVLAQAAFSLSLGRTIMSATNDAVAAINQRLLDATSRITGKISELEAQVANPPAVDNTVDPATLTALENAADALDAVVPTPATPVVVEPDPAVPSV